MNALQITCTKRERTTKDRIITSVHTRAIGRMSQIEYALIEVIRKDGTCQRKVVDVFRTKEQAEQKRNEYGMHDNECRCLRIEEWKEG